MPDGTVEARVSPRLPSISDTLRRRRAATPPPGEHAVDNLTGALLVATRGTWQLLEGYDESYFMYFEDADLCHRAKRAGIQAILAAEAVTHRVGGTETAPGARARWYRDGQRRYFARWRPRWEQMALHALVRLSGQDGA